MSKFKGTPGPWSVFYDHPTIPGDIAYIRQSERTQFDGLEIASLYGTGKKDPDPDRRRADASLMSSAPDLFDLVNTANSSIYGTHTKFWQDKAKAVIARVLGQDAQD